MIVMLITIFFELRLSRVDEVNKTRYVSPSNKEKFQILAGFSKEDRFLKEAFSKYSFNFLLNTPRGKNQKEAFLFER